MGYSDSGEYGGGFGFFIEVLENEFEGVLFLVTGELLNFTS